MKKRAFVLVALLCLLWQSATAQGDVATDIKQLQSQMYRLYSGNDFDAFMEVTEQLKKACLQANDERTFYKTWGNQALYIANRQRRNQGLQTAKDMQEYAVQHNSQFGIYTGMHVSACIMSMMGNFKEAQATFTRSIDFLRNHFPNETAAPGLIELAKIAYTQRHAYTALDYTEQALKDPHITPMHRLNALSTACIAVTDSSLYKPKGTDNETVFKRYYAEREKAKKAFGRDDTYGQRIEIWRMIYNRQYEGALELCEKVGRPLTRWELKQLIYKRMGNYKQAYYAARQHSLMRDSMNSAQNGHLLMEMTAALDLGRVELEAKELKLHNQQLELEQAASELEQRRLKEEALSLSLKNRDVELQNAAVRLQNDSLDRHNKEIQLREYETKMEAERSAAHARTLITALLGMLAALTIAYLAFYLNRRRKRLRQLQEAYDRLEETTSAKERIESELRIARDIQMSMVPSTFPAYPDRRDIDLYAQMVPAKAVGGDLYDFFLQNERLYFCVGDVSGKGVPASMTMAVAVQLFRTIAKEGFPPAYVATKLNDTLSADNESGMFVTMFIGMIDLQTGRMDYCNAGHNPPVIIDRPLSPGQSQRACFMEMETNAPAGLWPGLEYIGEHIENVKGRQLFIYTDGVNEAENITQEQYGDDRLLRLLSEATPPLGENTPKSRSRYIVERVRRSVQAFVAEAEQSDDLTMLCLSIGNLQNL